MSDVEVGKAYRGRDGLVRWVVHESHRHIYSCLWLDEERNVWYSGGKYKEHQLHYVVGEEVPAPQPGDCFTLIGAYGQPREIVAQDWD